MLHGGEKVVVVFVVVVEVLVLHPAGMGKRNSTLYLVVVVVVPHIIQMPPILSHAQLLLL